MFSGAAACVYDEPPYTTSHQGGSLRLLLVVLADIARREDGVCWPAVEEVAARLGLTERQTRRLISQGEACGELYRHVVHGRGRRSLFFVTSGLEADEVADVLCSRFAMGVEEARRTAVEHIERRSRPASSAERRSGQKGADPPKKPDIDDLFSAAEDLARTPVKPDIGVRFSPGENLTPASGKPDIGVRSTSYNPDNPDLETRAAEEVNAARAREANLSFLGGGDEVFEPVVRGLLRRFAPEETPALVQDQWGVSFTDEATLEWFRQVYRERGFEQLVAAVVVTRDRTGGRPSIKFAGGVLRHYPRRRPGSSPVASAAARADTVVPVDTNPDARGAGTSSLQEILAHTYAVLEADQNRRSEASGSGRGSRKRRPQRQASDPSAGPLPGPPAD